MMERILAAVLLFSSQAMAMGQPAGGESQGGMAGMFIPLLLMFGVLYLFMIRPAQKKQKEKEKMLSALTKGDRVVTSGGIYGDIQTVKENSVILRVADNVKLEVQRGSIGAVLAKAGADSDESE